MLKQAGKLASKLLTTRQQYNDTVLRSVAKELSKDEMTIKDVGQLALDLSKPTLHNYGAGMAAPQMGISKRLFVLRHEFFTISSPLTGIPFSQGTSDIYNAKTPAIEASQLFKSPTGLFTDIDTSSIDTKSIQYKDLYRAFSLPPRKQESLVIDVLREALMKKSPCVVVMNPIIVQSSTEQFLGNEGCFSVPEWQGEVQRPIVVDVEFDTFDIQPDVNNYDSPNPFDPSAENVVRKKLTLREFAARAFLHEVDHLNGVLFVDHIDANSLYFVANEGDAIYADELTDNELKRAPPLKLLYPVSKNLDVYA